ncbi:MAG: LamG domain-containing protein [Saccharofermentanales bacterium]
MRKNRFYSKVIGGLMCLSMVCLISIKYPVNAVTQAGPMTVATATQIFNTGAGFIDSPLSTWNYNGTQYWIHSDNWGSNHQKMSGPKDNPLQTPIFNKTRAQFFSNNASINGNPWIVSIYKDSYNGLLAFLHMESVTVGGSSAKGRIALAYSTDNGDTFKYLGEIVAPYNDPDMTGGFIVGCPYLVKDGYFYIYYQEYGINCARASVSDVIAAARNDTVTTWHKYYNGGWSENGMFGNRSALAGASTVTAYGITHTQAAYSTYDGKYYLALTMMNWGGQDTFVHIMQSSDCVTWELYKTVVQEPASNYPANSGWQYSSIVDYGSNGNATVGQLFYLYCGNFTDDLNEMTLRRWTIDLSNAPIGLWNLNNDANDSSGLNNGSLVNGPSYVAGKSGNAISLDGTNDYMNIPDAANLSGMPQLTLSCWVKLAQLPAQNYVIVGKDSTDYQYRIVVDSNGYGHFVVNNVHDSWYGSGTIASWSSPLSINTWYHIVGTYDGNYVRVFINGALAGTGSQPIYGEITTGTSPLRIGYKSGSIIDYTRGIIDEVQIYNKALNATEVDNLYDRYNMTATSHVASTEFSSTQGTNGWYYKEWNGSSYSNMTWSGANGWWVGSEQYSIVGGTWQHPGAAVESVRAWQASASNNIEIKGSAIIGAGYDGVIVTIMKNSDVIWTGTLAASTGLNFDILTNVVSGDYIYFKVNKNINNYNDSTTINPVIIIYS